MGNWQYNPYKWSSGPLLRTGRGPPCRECTRTFAIRTVPALLPAGVSRQATSTSLSVMALSVPLLACGCGPPNIIDLLTVYTLIRHANIANTSSKGVGVIPNLKRWPLDVQGLIIHVFFLMGWLLQPGRVQCPQIIPIRFSRGRDSLLHHRFGGSYRKGVQCMTRWWFQIFFIFTPIWGNDPFWRICFKGVGSTTN